MSQPPAPDLRAIVKQRARELRAARVGYSDCVTTIAEELYRSERGKATRIGAMGATPGLALLVEGDGEVFGKTKKAKAAAISKLAVLISPWVSDLYEEPAGRAPDR